MYARWTYFFFNFSTVNREIFAPFFLAVSGISLLPHSLNFLQRQFNFSRKRSYRKNSENSDNKTAAKKKFNVYSIFFKGNGNQLTVIALGDH